jgi:hypothetical protein
MSTSIRSQFCGRTDVRQDVPTIAGLPRRVAVSYTAFIILAFAFYSLAWANAPLTEGDSAGYLRAAQDLADFHVDQLQQRAPGYPVLLVLTGSSQAPTRTLFVVSLWLHFASIWVLGTLLYQGGLTAVWLNLFCALLLLPPFVEPAAYVLSENLAEATLVAGFGSLCLWIRNGRPIWICLSSLAVGYAGLTRPAFQLLAMALAVGLVLLKALCDWIPLKWTQATHGGAALLCVSLLLLGGFASINYRHFKFFGIAPTLGPGLSTKTLRVVERLPDQYAAIREVLVRARDEDLVSGSPHTGHDYIFRAWPELAATTGLDDIQLSESMLRLNLELIKGAPLSYLQEVAWAFGSYWLPSSGVMANFNSRAVHCMWSLTQLSLVTGGACNLMLLLGAVVYVRKCLRFVPRDAVPAADRRFISSQGIVYALAGLIVAYTAAVSCVIQIGTPRYRVPTDSLIVFMFFLGTALWSNLVDLAKTVLSVRSADILET